MSKAVDNGRQACINVTYYTLGLFFLETSCSHCPSQKSNKTIARAREGESCNTSHSACCHYRSIEVIGLPAGHDSVELINQQDSMTC